MLKAREFTVYTDHKPLTYALNQKLEEASPRQAHHLDFIAQFTSDIRHISGVNNGIADLLSRIESIDIPLDYTALAEAQKEDKDFKSMLEARSSLSFKTAN